MDSEVTGSKGKRRRLWVAGGVGAVLVVGVLAGLAANGSRSGNASDIISFTCSGQTFWFDKTVTKMYGDIENKADKLVNAEDLKSECNPGVEYFDSRKFYDFLWETGNYTGFWVLDEDGKRCTFSWVSNESGRSYKLNFCYRENRTDELYVLRKD